MDCTFDIGENRVALSIAQRKLMEKEKDMQIYLSSDEGQSKMKKCSTKNKEKQLHKLETKLSDTNTELLKKLRWPRQQIDDITSKYNSSLEMANKELEDAINEAKKKHQKDVAIATKKYEDYKKYLEGLISKEVSDKGAEIANITEEIEDLQTQIESNIVVKPRALLQLEEEIDNLKKQISYYSNLDAQAMARFHR